MPTFSLRRWGSLSMAKNSDCGRSFSSRIIPSEVGNSLTVCLNSGRKFLTMAVLLSEDMVDGLGESGKGFLVVIPWVEDRHDCGWGIP